jgi:hypothetical protein
MLINDCLKKVFTSEQLTQEDFNNIQNALASKFGRNHFAKQIYQSKFKENKHVILSVTSFEDLYKIIISAIIQAEDVSSQYDDIRLITKSTFYYYK